MRVPAASYGLTRDVKLWSRRVLTKLRRGAPWPDATAGPMTDTAEHPGLIVLDGPSPLLGSTPHFHVYLPVRAALEGALTDPRIDRESVFEQCLATAWGCLGLLGQHGQSLVGDLPVSLGPAAARRLVDACARHWEDWRQSGERFSAGLPTGSALWRPARSLYVALATLGVERDALVALIDSPPPAGLADWLARRGLVSGA